MRGKDRTIHNAAKADTEDGTTIGVGCSIRNPMQDEDWDPPSLLRVVIAVMCYDRSFETKQ